MRFAFFDRPRRAASAALAMLLSMSFWPPCITAAAQSQVQSRVVTRDEGEAIVDAISERRPLQGGRRAKPDCSHLVNDVYNDAGFPYVYAKSYDLYRGHPSFARAKFPQPGDLIVWRGHVGLVTNPREHLFYSSLRSGFDVEDYTSAYWTKHGTPRFYRYRITNDQPHVLARKNMAEPYERASNANFKTLPVKQSALEDQPENSLTGESGALPLPDSNSGDSLNSDASAVRSIAGEIPIIAGKHKPSIEKVNEAFSRMIRSSSDAAEVQNLLRSSSTVVIFTKLQVNQLQFKSNRGSADISIDSNMYMTGGELHKIAHHDQEHWEILRSGSGWKLVAPSANIYLSRADATRIFARQLARLTENSVSENSNALVSEEANLASILNALLTN